MPIHRFIKIASCLLLTLFITSCGKQIMISDYKYNYQFDNKLPKQKIGINLNSFQTNYLKNVDSTFLTDFYCNVPDSSSVILMDSAFNLNLQYRIEDALILINDNFVTNVFNDDMGNGYIIVKIKNFESKSRYKILYIPHILTLYLLGYFNVPYYFYESKIEIETSIYNKEHKLLSTYECKGKKLLPIRFYGYFATAFGRISGFEGGARKSNIECVKIALNELNKKISEDYGKLLNGLKNN